MKPTGLHFHLIGRGRYLALVVIEVAFVVLIRDPRLQTCCDTVRLDPIVLIMSTLMSAGLTPAIFT